MSISTVFADFLLSTDEAAINNPNQLRQAVSERTFFIPRMLSGKSPEHSLQGGSSIKTFIQLDEASSAHFYGIGDEESPVQPQTVSPLEVAWRFCRADETWDEETVERNVSGLGKKARHRKLFDLKRQIENQSTIDKCNFIERKLWAAPSGSLQEPINTGREPHSLISIVTEEANGIPTGFTTQGFTTFEGADPAAKPAWRPQAIGYDQTGVGTASSALFTALSKCYRKVGYATIPMGTGVYADKYTSPTVVACSLHGLTYIEKEMRASQDLFVYFGRQDPSYPNPTIHGVPFEYVSALDTARSFPTSATPGQYEEEWSQNGTDNAGPRFLFFNLRDVNLYFHTDKFWYKHPMLTPYRQPSRHTIYNDTHYNVVCENRRNQGIVFPTADAAAPFIGSAP